MKFISVAISLFFSLISTAAYLSPQEVEDSLSVMLSGIAMAAEDHIKLENSQNIEALLESELLNPELSNHEFSTIKKMAILQPEDKKFRLYNWNIPLNNGENKFFCYITFTTKKGEHKIEKLIQPNRQEKKLEARYLDLDSWYGCLYYDIIPVKKGKKVHYTLLGYSPEKKAMTKKYIDVLTISNDIARLGAPIFETEKGIKKRVIFKFSAEVSMTVRWQEKTDRIILDHLEPRSPQMEGNFMFYGPDGTFDCYTLVKDKWVLEKGVDFRSTEKSEKVYRDPRFFRNRKK